LVVSSCLLASAAAQESTSPIAIGSRRELFVDRLLIEKLDGATLKMFTPTLAPPVSPPRPHGPYMTVLRDGDLFRFYYRGDKDPKVNWKTDGWEKYHDGEVTLAAESKDAIHWTLPNYGIYSLPIFPAGNVILADEFLTNHNFTPLIDSRPGVPKEERFKALGGLHYQPHHGEIKVRRGWPGGLRAYVSADGVHWKRLRDEPVIPDDWGVFDSQNTAFWSEHEGMYVCYFRIFDGGKRSIARTTSRDFLSWTDPVAMKPNAQGEELYTSCTQPYFRAPHIYVALPTRFVAKRGAATDIAFMTTRGGNQYHREFLESMIRPGLDVSGWGNRANYAAIGIHPTSATEMSLFAMYGKRYTLRLDGFTSLNAPFTGGEMTTKPLTFAGKELEINYSTSAGGVIWVELQDATGKAIPGYTLDDCKPIFGDKIAHIVEWQNGRDVASLAGKLIRLRVAMEDADLYSFKFNE
jgi:hypothetical protein